jgi:penicillin-binding protein 2
MGAAVLLVIGALFLQAWNLEVLQGSAFAAAATSNRTRRVSLPAARGNILDDKGRVLVGNRAVMEVTAMPAVAQDTTLEARLSAAIGVSVQQIQKAMTNYKAQPLAPRVLRVGVPMTAVAYLYEHQAFFPGVSVEPAAVRVYPNKQLAAQVLGYTGEISDQQLKSGAFPGAQLGTIVGKSGVEEYYDHALEGEPGFDTFEVNAAGQPTATVAHADPRVGSDVELTIDRDVQAVAEKSLRDAIATAHSAGFTKAKAGAAVVLDVKTGGVVAMASAPTYDPSQFVNGISTAQWASLTATSAEFPLTNRAIMSSYPPGSTFKAIVAMGALQDGIIRASTQFNCVGIWKNLGRPWKKNWTTVDQGWHSVVWAIEQSSDTFFYNVGEAFWKAPGEKLQAFARSVGLGSTLGIDLPGEAPGRVPNAAWKKAFNSGYPQYQGWVGGDTVNMAIGQGDLLVTPLQLCDYYATLANGGHPMKPHVLKAVLSDNGTPALLDTPTVIAQPRLSAANLATLRQALVAVTTAGTGASAFSGFPIEVAGKTGTAQVKGKSDYAWFACYAPANNPRYAVVVMVEQGGEGGATAAPAARQIMCKLFNVPWRPIIAHDNSR